MHDQPCQQVRLNEPTRKEANVRPERPAPTMATWYIPRLEQPKMQGIFCRGSFVVQYHATCIIRQFKNRRHSSLLILTRSTIQSWSRICCSPQKWNWGRLYSVAARQARAVWDLLSQSFSWAVWLALRTTDAFGSHSPLALRLALLRSKSRSKLWPSPFLSEYNQPSISTH